jgi:hypothetical protein
MIGQPLCSRAGPPHVNTVTIDVAFVDHNVANIDTRTDLNAITFGNVSIVIRHATLDFNRAGHCNDRTRKFDQQAFTCGFNDAAIRARVWSVYFERNDEELVNLNGARWGD